ncbi:hypothetical protein PGTUg99_004592 [Puccinia graminis f. sp. tritici]|uniref:Uncharacterized protein n=1 Tax=Puccinia graminis f. sp. tritici TaxID=56615 RepID=A0A5B0NAG4_PUCGR|nr:hypothetical protein PGTUg99_004592 [Puccinia graminis f. sp. tritici]
MRSIKQVIRLAENSRGYRSVPSVSAHPRNLPVASSVEKFSEPLQHPYTRPGPRDNPCLMTPGCRDRSSMDKGLIWIHVRHTRETMYHFMNFGPYPRRQRVTLRPHLQQLKIHFKAERLDKVFGNRKAEAALSRFLLDTNRFPEHLPR